MNKPFVNQMLTNTISEISGYKNGI